MKCVKNLHDNSISRVSDERACELVAAGTHAFCKKEECKQINSTTAQRLTYSLQRKALNRIERLQASSKVRS